MKAWFGAALPPPAVARTALAAAAAWQLAAWLVGERPYFAPLAAILCTQVTAAASVARGLERSLGVAVGIVLALGAARTVGANALTVGALAFLGMALAQRLGMGVAAVSQVPVSAILVLSVGAHQPGYAAARVADTVIGAATAVALQVFVLPPDYTPDAAREIRRLAARLVRLWRRAGRATAKAPVAAAASDRPDAPGPWLGALALEPHAREAQARLALALDALRLSPLRRRRRLTVVRLEAAFVALERSLRHSAAVLRVIGDRPEAFAAADRALLARAGALTALAAGAIAPRGTGRAVAPARAPTLALAALGAIAAARAAADTPLPPGDAAARPYRAAVAVELEEWRRDLERALAAAAPPPQRHPLRLTRR